jgi:hypothetical protein
MGYYDVPPFKIATIDILKLSVMPPNGNHFSNTRVPNKNNIISLYDPLSSSKVLNYEQENAACQVETDWLSSPPTSLH